MTRAFFHRIFRNVVRTNNSNPSLIAQQIYLSFLQKYKRLKHEWVNPFMRKSPWSFGYHYLCIYIMKVIFRKYLNPSRRWNTFVQSTRMQRFLETIQTLSCWYSLDSSHRVLSYEFQFVRVSVIFQVLCIILYLPNLPPAA